jgi:phenylacetate-coenzyme A ligase PaaK-like adenylate-forming protein
LERLVEAMLETKREFGALGAEAAEMLHGPALDEAARRDFQLRRFRAQAVRASRETVYYERWFKDSGLHPAQLRSEDIARIPVTSKTALQGHLADFVRRSAQPGIQAYPTSLYFSSYELRLTVALTAIDLLLKDEANADDVIQLSYPRRASLLNLVYGSAYARLGALVQPAGQIALAQALALLTNQQALPGKKARPSILLAYPSYLGELVECGLQSGCRPADFSLERVVTTGEILTEGLKERCQQLFGPVRFSESYTVTALLPWGGTRRADGNLEFGLLPGLLEVINPDTAAPAQPGEIGTIVATPFLPYRETMLLLRFDTQDVVRALNGGSVTTPVLGKLSLSARHNKGWTFQREVQEALEVVEEVPLPAHYGFWAVPGGVAVEVLVRKNTADARRKLEARLIEGGVPVAELRLVESLGQLQRPIPLRCDERDDGTRS